MLAETLAYGSMISFEAIDDLVSSLMGSTLLRYLWSLMPLEFVWFIPPNLLLLFGGTTSSNDVFQLCFQIKCMVWIFTALDDISKQAI